VSIRVLPADVVALKSPVLIIVGDTGVSTLKGKVAMFHKPRPRAGSCLRDASGTAVGAG